MRERERAMLLEAVDSGWIAPVGPALDAFEGALAARTGRQHGVGLSSGTAGLHLLLKELGVGAGDAVMVSTFTFAASANAAVYVGAEPVFVDSDSETWNISPELVADELKARAANNTLPRAAVVVDLYGQCCDYDVLLPLFAEYDVAVIEDAAEALGATYRGRPAGSFGPAAVLSFNGNKIITTSGGGAVVTDDGALAARVRHLSTQAREPVVHYEHTEIGFNYRLSNLLAAFGHGQLLTLDERIARKRAINERYQEALAHVDGVEFLEPASYGEWNAWLTCITIDPSAASCTRADVQRQLEERDIESRPTWKPLHMQPVFKDAPARVDGTSERIFERGLCLPSGSGMPDSDLDRVTDALAQVLR